MSYASRPYASQPFAGPAKGSNAAYVAAVLADAPWGYWGVGGGFNDRAGSGGGAALQASGAGVTYSGTGPFAQADTWTMPQGQFWWSTNSYGQAAPSIFTYEGWVLIPPGAGVSGDSMLLSFTGINSSTAGSSGSTGGLQITAANKVRLAAYVASLGGPVNLESPTALTPGYHHVAVSIGDAGQKVYVDGALVASNLARTAVDRFGTNSWCYIHGNFNGIGQDNTAATIQASHLAVWPGRQLTDAQIAAHYAAATATALPGGYYGQVRADSPAGYWRLGDTIVNGGAAIDSSANGRYGAYNTNVGSVVTASSLLLGGDTNAAASFSGGGFMRVGSVPDSPTITVEAIIKPTAATLGGSQPIASRWVSSNSGQRWILWVNAGKLQGYVYSDANGNGNATGVTTLVAGQTYHVAMTYDGSTIRVYINGVLDGSAAWGNPISTNSTPFMDVARVSDSTAGNMTVDEVAYYTTALPQQRLAAHYSAAVTSTIIISGGKATEADAARAGTAVTGHPSVVLADAPLLYWKLDETSGTTVVDSSGFQHNGISENGMLVGQTSLLGDGTGRSAYFDGNNDDAFIFNAAWMNITAVTVEARVQLAAGALNPPDARVILGRDGTANRGWNLNLGTANKFQFSAFIAGVQKVVTGTTVATVGPTYTVAGSYDGANLKIYVNGVLEGTLAVTGALAQPTVLFAIGNMQITAGQAAYNWLGYIDEVAWYGTALSDGRLAIHHASAVRTVTGTVTATTIIGGRATETDAARAGTVTKAPVTKVGGTAAETDTSRAGLVAKSLTKAGGRVVEADAARAGTVTKGPLTRVGGKVVETDTARAGSVTSGSSLRTVQGGRVVETDTARVGSVTRRTTISGGQAVETDAARAGVTSQVAAGPVVPTVVDLLLLDEDGTFDSDQISSAALIDRTHWWSYTPTDVLDLTFDLDDTVPVDWAPTVDPDTDVESDPPTVDAVITLYTGTSVDNLSVVTSGISSITPTGLAVGTTYYVRASIPAGDPDVLYQLSVGPAADTQLYLMDLEVLSGPLRGAPTAVVVQVMGGPADDTVTFKIDGVDVPGTWDLDPFGNLPPTSVAVPEATTKGEHVISVHSDSTDLAGEGTFTLSRNPYVNLQVVGLDADPVEIPDANTSTGVRRWVLQDLMPGGLGSWVMVRNPTSMSSPEYQRTLFQEHTTAKDGQYHLSSVALQSFEWTFSGYVDTEFEQNQLLAYYGLNRRFYVIDHRTRAWMVAWQRCEIVPRKRQRNDDSSFNDWAADYTVTALIYDQDPRVPR